ncbi:MAG: TIGR04283 family arsenosugar biosynthesis glycosyltransferase [Rhodospirillales bacterium]|nr:TIGR04283 family arsenosugar biosynthesis glycosyltransferase [Rhodospirillales bacterium]
MISAIIPTLNAGNRLGATLGCLARYAEVGEVIVADGGSADATREIAAKAGARLIEARRGRGPQLADGAKAATGDWLLFLHADTVLTGEWPEAVSAFVGDPANREKAGVFRLKLDDDSAAARRVERFVAWRTRVLGLPYGDQGLLMARDFYQSLGGFKAIPLMEDVDIVRRIGGRRLAMLDADAVTSAARYRQRGYLRRGARNLFCLALYFLGISPERIERIYR